MNYTHVNNNNIVNFNYTRTQMESPKGVAIRSSDMQATDTQTSALYGVAIDFPDHPQARLRKLNIMADMEESSNNCVCAFFEYHTCNIKLSLKTHLIVFECGIQHPCNGNGNDNFYNYTKKKLYFHSDDRCSGCDDRTRLCSYCLKPEPEFLQNLNISALCDQANLTLIIYLYKPLPLMAT